ncbi:MAG: restriction endonuclease-like protein [Firmicutes bacterium]|nr:restriction endonuclease-like protein [Bacillota bacterium]
MPIANLVFVSTPAFDLVIKGPTLEETDFSSLGYNVLIESSTFLNGTYNGGQVYHSDLGLEVDLPSKHPPLFFEQTNYEIIIECKEKGDLVFRHQNPELQKAIKPLRSHSNIWSGVINFRGEIGNCELRFIWNSKNYLGVTLEVFPGKLDYRSDYADLLAEVFDKVHSLAFDVLTKTTSGVKSRWEGKQSDVEWFTILRLLISELERSVKEIASRPHHRLVEEEVFRPLHQVKRGGGRTKKWLQRHQKVLKKEANPKILEYRKKIDYDTIENRFVKYVLRRISNKVDTLYRRVSETTSSTKTEQLLKVLRDISSRLKKLMALDFMKQVENFHGSIIFSLVLQFAPGYREVFRNYIALMKGLNIQGRVFKVGLKSLPELYEYWCFLRLREVLSYHYEIASDEIIKVIQEGIVLKLEKGVATKTIFKDSNGGEVILGYNMKPEIKSPTTSQKPDVLLTIDRKVPGGYHRYILDAKYRIETEKNYQNKFGGIGPKEEDINTMHRYRDAFFGGRTDVGFYSRDALGACVLFPWKKNFQHHQFYTSLSKVGIGALPFLPGQTGLVEQFLSELLKWPDVKHVQQAILPRGHDVFWGRRYHNEPVLIGTLGSKNREKRLDFARDNGYYHIPTDSLASKRLGFEYVAFFANGKIDYYVQVEKIMVKRERELEHITDLRPIKSPGGDKLYYQVFLKPGTWNKLLRPIINSRRRRVNFEDTTLEALLTARTIDELKLKREIERRLLEAAQVENLDYQVNAPDEQFWELILVKSHGVIKRHLTVDGVEVWPQGATRQQNISGSMVRQKPDYVLKIAQASEKKDI